MTLFLFIAANKSTTQEMFTQLLVFITFLMIWYRFVTVTEQNIS